MKPYNPNDDLLPPSKRRLVRFCVIFAHLLIVVGPLLWTLIVFEKPKRESIISVQTIANPAPNVGPVEQAKTAPSQIPPAETPPSPPTSETEPEPIPPKPEPVTPPPPKPPEPKPEPPKPPEVPKPVKKPDPPKETIKKPEKKPEPIKKPTEPVKKPEKKQEKKPEKKPEPVKKPEPPKEKVVDKPLKRPPIPQKKVADRPLKRPPVPKKETTPSGWKRLDDISEISEAKPGPKNDAKAEEAKSPPSKLPPIPDLPVAGPSGATQEENEDYANRFLKPYVAAKFEPLCPKRMDISRSEPSVDVEISVRENGLYSWKIIRASGEPKLDEAVKFLFQNMSRVPKKEKGPFPYVTTITFTVE